MPSCAAVRPARCPACAAVSREPGKPLVIVGHGQRSRSVEGPPAPDEPPAAVDVRSRRYRCRACGAVLVVVPRGIARCYRYALTAIAWALALWGSERRREPEVRLRTSTAKSVGPASATRWASLRRWTLRADVLFGATLKRSGTLRACAASIATFAAAHAPVLAGPVPVDAFHGAAFCQPR